MFWESLKQKVLDDLNPTILYHKDLSIKQINAIINSARRDALSKGEAVPIDLPAGVVRSKFLSQLATLKKRFEKTTNQLDGKAEFVHDIEQCLLWWQDVKEAWPLKTLGIQYRTFVSSGPNKCKQTLYDV